MIMTGGLLGAALAWQAMMTVMMAPTAYPWLRAAARLAPEGAASPLPAVDFGAGYFLAWMPFSLTLAAVQFALGQRLNDSAAWQGSLLLAAGLYQFVPLKRACLRHCRHPLSFLTQRWEGGPPSLVVLGARHGLVCLGCCWALMATALAVGMENLLWMLVLALAVFAEQTLDGGAWLRPTLGLALAAIGASQFI